MTPGRSARSLIGAVASGGHWGFDYFVAASIIACTQMSLTSVLSFCAGSPPGSIQEHRSAKDAPQPMGHPQKNAHNAAQTAATARSHHKGQGPHGHRAQRVRRPLPLRFSKTGRPARDGQARRGLRRQPLHAKASPRDACAARCARTRHCGAVAYGDEECTLYRTGALNGSTPNACVASFRTNERPATGEVLHHFAPGLAYRFFSVVDLKERCTS